MIPIIWMICGVLMIISAFSAKKNPEKLLASKKRKKKANLTDEEYISNVYKTSIICGIIFILLGVIWIATIG